MTDFDAYFFDLDGTLVDSAPDLAHAVNLCLKEGGGGEVTVQSVRDWVGQGAKALLTACFQSVGVPDPDRATIQTFIDHYTANLARDSVPYPGVRSTLQALWAREKKLAVVTNKYSYLAVPLLEALEMAEYFEVIVGAETADKPKPAPDPIYYACEQLGVRPDQAIMIGDSSYDERAAVAAGTAYAQVTYGYKDHGERQKDWPPPRLIDSFEALLH